MKWEGDWLKCPDKGKCGFTINGLKIIEIFKDENHIIHQHMTAHEKQIFQEALKDSMEVV